MPITVGLPNEEFHSISIYVPETEVENFKAMVSRAINTWQQPPESIRELADAILGHSHWPKSSNVMQSKKRSSHCPNCGAHGQHICPAGDLVPETPETNNG